MALTKIDDRGLKTPIDLLDNEKIRLGTGNDLEIYHDGTDSIIASSTGDLQITDTSDDITITAADDIRIRPQGGENGINVLGDGAVQLYYDNDEKFATGAIGVYSKSIMPASHETYDIGQNMGRWNDIYIADNGKLRLGQGDDLQLYHDGNSRVVNTNNGVNLILQSDYMTFRGNSANENYLKCIPNGAVELYHDNTKHFETISNGVKVDSASDAILELHTSNNTAHSRINFSNDSGDNYGGLWYSASNALEFRTNNAERMRLSSSSVGQLFIGCTAEPTSGSSGIMIQGNGFQAIGYAGTGSGNFLEFNNANGNIGKINGNGSTTTYFTSSDYRLKENVSSISDGITRLKTLKPYKFNFKTEPSVTLDGFFAHEVSSAVPIAVYGDKDATKEDGSIDPQGIDHSKLVPLLTAALQEAITKIETLETKVAALEAA